MLSHLLWGEVSVKHPLIWGGFGVRRIYIGTFVKHSLSRDSTWGRAINDERWSVLYSCLGRPPRGPLPPCHPPNGENTKACDWIADDDSNTNNRSYSWVIRKSKQLMEKSIFDSGNGEKKPLSLEIKQTALKGWKKEDNANSNSSKWMNLHKNIKINFNTLKIKL